MQTWAIGLIIVGVIIVAICAAVGIYYLSLHIRRKNGTLALSRVTSRLKRFAGVRSFEVLEDLTLTTGKKETVKVDRALITFNHVLLFDVRSECDSIYGDAKDPTWVSVKSDSHNNTLARKSFDNPFREAQKANDAVRRILAQNKLGKIQTEFYVVFPDPKVTLSIGNGMPVLGWKEFKSLLTRSKYSKDGPVDVKAVAELLKK